MLVITGTSGSVLAHHPWVPVPYSIRGWRGGSVAQQTLLVPSMYWALCWELQITVASKKSNNLCPLGAYVLVGEDTVSKVNQ